MDPLPHDNWAQFYDFVYQQTFGPVYNQFTEITLQACNKIITKTGKKKVCILDVGAGTGRLTIPLLQNNHGVTAVEPSVPMCEQIKKNAGSLPGEQRQNLTVIQQPMQSAPIQANAYDIALCVFTVIAYITDEEDLKKAINTISKGLNDGGFLLLDIPIEDVFQDPAQCHKPLCHRQVTIKPVDHSPNLYIYQEKCSGCMDGKDFDYSDQFQLRKWSNDEIKEICRSYGLDISEYQDEIVGQQFRGKGATYCLFKKRWHDNKEKPQAVEKKPVNPLTPAPGIRPRPKGLRLPGS